MDGVQGITVAQKKIIVNAAKTNVANGVNVLLVGKVGLYTTNHHIWQGKLNTIMSKVLSGISPGLA